MEEGKEEREQNSFALFKEHSVFSLDHRSPTLFPYSSQCFTMSRWQTIKFLFVVRQCEINSFIH